MIAKKLLEYRSANLSKKNKFSRASIGYKDVKAIGILFTVETKAKHKSIKAFIKQLEEDGKKVEVLSYLPKKTENHKFLFDFFTSKDINFWGNLTSDAVENFSNSSFDYLFYLDTKSNYINRAILAKSKANCRITQSDELNAPYAEMMVDVVKKEDIEQLIGEMYKYTKLLS